jgi:hypothetical protein
LLTVLNKNKIKIGMKGSIKIKNRWYSGNQEDWDEKYKIWDFLIIFFAILFFVLSIILLIFNFISIFI